MKPEVLLDVKNLKKYFTVGQNQTLKAVDDVTLQIYKGETLGLVGESGCGKSTFGRTVIHLYEPTAGEVTFDGLRVDHTLSRRDAHNLTQRMQMIFQDPYASLNPRRKILDIVAEGIDSHNLAKNRKERNDMVVSLLETVGLQAEHADRFPHEFSGGQRQRVGIARALAVNPDFIVCDEPISALDVSIQAQVVNLLEQLQEERGLTYLFIAHDLSMVRHISDRIGVMYLGSLVELAETEELFSDPIHPYTKALLSAIPVPEPDIEKNRQRIVLEGTLPNPIGLGDECKFCSRCPQKKDGCKKAQPKLREVKPGHFVACSECC
ncbi:ABC transporter ATP-binding protein [Ruminococcus sp. 5_1_39BFAA]|uniref:ABC transporter ATP-binding protein n=1 Tax=Ruminococcus sp. 5_1_39BFAA TaxID=457412 RepID=UPI0035667623